LIAAPHRGISTTRNHGLDALPADAEFVTFQDSDDIAYPGRIARQLRRLRSDPDVQVVYGLLQIFDLWDDGSQAPSKSGRTMTTRGISLSAGLFRRTIIDHIGRFDESLTQAEDTDFLFRLVESGANMHMEDEIATYYRRHDTNTTLDVAVGRRDFMKAIHKSVKRRPADRQRIAALCNGMFADRRKFEEGFETCSVNTQS
jgi:glycosyltransferase involved in cell wall biosynthesis